MKAKSELDRIVEIGNIAVQKAQAENRRLGIPNYYSINGKIVSDQELMKAAKKRKAK